MAIPAKSLTIDEMNFQLHPLKGLQVLRLDRKVVTMLTRVFKGIKDVDNLLDLDVSNIADALDSLSDEEYMAFVTELLSTVMYLPTGGTPVQLSRDEIDTHFGGNAIVLYKLIYEVMRYNRFSPFVLMEESGFGAQIQKMLSSVGKQSDAKKPGNGLVKLEPSGRK